MTEISGTWKVYQGRAKRSRRGRISPYSRAYHVRMKLSLRNVGLGFVVAAAGIGGSDVSLAAFTGSRFGLTLLWAIALGAVLKFTLNEGVARWQLATGESILEGLCTRMGLAGRLVFLLYLLPWTFFVGASLMSACGVVATTVLPLAADHEHSRLIWGALHSAVAIALVFSGGFPVFRRVMGLLTLVMVVTVLSAAILLRPDPLTVMGGIFWPRVPAGVHGGQWTLALLGGVGGTLTLLAYGYWIREAGIHGLESLPGCRLDLACGYVMTALFGIALTVIAAGAPISSGGEDLFHRVSERLTQRLGPVGGRLYLAGVWCAVSACMLGVWQSAPLMFADWMRLVRRGRQSGGESIPVRRPATDSDAADGLQRTWTYRVYLLLLGTLPLITFEHSFASVQRWFGVIGAAFVPLLALALLIMNGRTDWVGKVGSNGWLARCALVLAALVTLGGFVDELRKLLSGEE